MPADLILRDQQVHSVFELLGTKENDITFSLGWALSRCDDLRRRFVQAVVPGTGAAANEKVSLQQFGKDGGYTDVELLSDAYHVIIEAKRGWHLPGMRQLQRYRPRFEKEGREHRCIVAMSACTPEYAKLHLTDGVDGVALRYMGWRQLEAMAVGRGGNHAERRLRVELATYLRRINGMQNQQSNMVYVVSLSNGRPDWSPITWREMVEQRRIYFNPVGEGCPKEPPNYIGFRFGGQLRYICHVDRWEIFHSLKDVVPDMRMPTTCPHFLFHLGPPIAPAKTVKNGAVYPSGRVWAMLDLLLTCNTVSEARDLSRKRIEALE